MMLHDVTSCLLLDAKLTLSLPCQLEPYILSPVGLDPSPINNGTEVESYADYIDIACQNLEDLEHCNHVVTDISFANSKVSVIDWMIWACHALCLSDRILINAVSIFNQTLEKTKDIDLLLCGVTSLRIAAKFHERLAPSVSEFVYLCNRKLTTEQICDAEVQILNAIGFNLGEPTVATFCDLVLSQVPIDEDFSAFISLFCNSVMLASLPYKPSQLAMAVITLSKMASDMPMNLQEALGMFSNVDSKLISQCMLDILYLTGKLMDAYGTAFDLKFGNFVSRVGFSPESLTEEINEHVSRGTTEHLFDDKH